ncbi:cysteine desulfurase family protein [Chryseomicrobium sp. FSL W7-1435]|uniref:cysteine desulfurase family protein n=1 Tax=Chryseomicrobium sp. FSL W7-1435 TaxID=2921704 RepID=UPI00315AFF98
MNRIYLDHAATSPVHPDVIQALATSYAECFGNASSIHETGRNARKQLDQAREVLAASIHAQPNEIILTSGGTEADNLAIIGAAYANQKLGKHIITSEIEHHAVLHACQQLEKEGFEVTYLPVTQQGIVTIESLKEALREDTTVVSIMHGNNEVGTVQQIAELSEVVKAHQAVFHTDAVQTYGSLEIDVTTLAVDLLSVSAHKLNGPKGIGFLYQRTGTKLRPLAHGGQQERKRRAGTEAVPLAVAFAKATEIKQQSIQKNYLAMLSLKKHFLEQLKTFGVDYTLNAEEANQLPHICNVFFPQTDIETFLIQLDLAGMDVSSGSACTAGAVDPSHVLVAMFGDNAPQLRSSVRFSFGLGTTKEQLSQAAEKIAGVVNRPASIWK